MLHYWVMLHFTDGCACFPFPARRSDPSGFVWHRRVVVVFVSELENGSLRCLDYVSLVISFLPNEVIRYVLERKSREQARYDDASGNGCFQQGCLPS